MSLVYLYLVHSHGAPFVLFQNILISNKYLIFTPPPFATKCYQNTTERRLALACQRVMLNSRLFSDTIDSFPL